VIRGAWARPTALLLVAATAFGCLSVRAKGRPAEGPGGAVALRLYADDAARRAGHPSPAGVLTELERAEGDGWRSVFRSLSPAWTVMGLPEGRYRLRFPARLAEDGSAVRLDEADTAVEVASGEVTEVEAVLEHVSPAAVAVGVAGAVVAAVLLHDWLQDHDLPLPKPPPEVVVDAALYFVFDFRADSEVWHDAGGPRVVVTSHFPEADAVVAARRLRVVFALSAPVDGHRLDPQGVTVLAEQAGLVPGELSYEDATGCLVWEPAEELPRDDVLHVTLAPEALEDAAGVDLPAPVSFSFKTTA
jgi:hypothetical protein